MWLLKLARNLRLWIKLKPLDEVVNWSVDEVKTALLVDVECLLASTFLEEDADVLHELIVVEVDANCSLKLFNIKLFEQ